MSSRESFSISARNNLYLNLLNLALFLIVALTGSVVQLEYHMHGCPEGYPVMGLEKSEWVLLHKASATLFLAGIICHCLLNWRFVSASTRRIFSRKVRPSASLSYWLFMICVPTCLTAMISWALFGSEHPVRFVLVESHDKLGWLLMILTVIHIVSRTGRMTAAFRTLHLGRGTCHPT